MAKYDIGIFGYTMGDNYGSIATYYALYKYIKSLGKRVCIIPPLFDSKYCGHSKDFFRLHCNCLKKLKRDNYYMYNNDVNTFVLGSDQMWNYDIFPGWGVYPYLSFVDEGHKKIAYAVSYGVDYPTFLDNTPSNFNSIKTLIQDFDYISHRESTGCQITDKWFNRGDTEHVVDPVFLVSNKVWNELINEINYEIPQNNILFYSVETALSYFNTFHKISSKLKLDETLISTNNTLKLRSNFERSILYDNEYPLNPPDSPLDFRIWLRYMRDSEKILVSSYHGICFSLIFKKNFVCFRSKNIYDTRKLDILKTVGLEDRIIDEHDIDKAIELYNTPIDWDSVYAKLNNLISISKTWLKTSLL